MKHALHALHRQHEDARVDAPLSRGFTIFPPLVPFVIHMSRLLLVVLLHYHCIVLCDRYTCSEFWYRRKVRKAAC